MPGTPHSATVEHMFDLGDSTETPGAAPSGLLTRVPESNWTDTLRRHHAAIARTHFAETDAVTVLYLARCAEEARRGRNDAMQGEFVSAEIGHILHLTERSAQRLIELGLDLRWRLHRTSNAFSAGRIDQARAFAISDALSNVSPDKLDLIEQLLLDDAEHLNTTTLRAKARRLIARHDPDGAAERRRSAEDDRDVRFRTNDDGTCAVEGTLPGPAGQVVAMRLRAMCFDVCGHDPRTFAQRRADALVALADGSARLACLCDRADCAKHTPVPTTRNRHDEPTPPDTRLPADDHRAAADDHCAAAQNTASADHRAPHNGGRTTGADSGAAVTTGQDQRIDGHPVANRYSTSTTLSPLPPTTILVGVNITTLLGLDDLPGHLAGFGAIDADLAREIASDATWRQVLTLTDTDRQLVVDALTERPRPDESSTVESHPADSSSHPPSTGVPDARHEHDARHHSQILGLGRSLAAAGVTPGSIRARTRTHREQLTYRPSTRLADVIRTRDGHCRFPGCIVRAASCDLDHTIPFAHDDPAEGGRTVEQNLACLCRRHHRLKTEGHWTVRQLSGGRLEWTTPGGDTVITAPGGAFGHRSDDEKIAAAHGLTLTDQTTLERHFGTHRGRDAVTDLYFLVEVHRPPPKHAVDLRQVVLPQRDIAVTFPPTIRSHAPTVDPAPF
ncbi:DUF222 domain-containing protein [Rhodococcus triatomae]